MNTHWGAGRYHHYYWRDQAESQISLDPTLLRSGPGERPESGWRVWVTNSVWCLQVYFPAPSTSSNAFLGVGIVNKTQGEPRPTNWCQYIHLSTPLPLLLRKLLPCPVWHSSLPFLQSNLHQPPRHFCQVKIKEDLQVLQLATQQLRITFYLHSEVSVMVFSKNIPPSIT